MVTDFDLDNYLQAEFVEHHKVFHATRDAVREDFAALLRACVDSVRAGGKLIFFGNGGSAADAQHLATELTVRYRKDRAPIAALALTTDSSALTAIGNDLGFEQLFARQLQAVGRRGDIAIAISTSGRSANIIEALKAARAMGLVAAGLTGGEGGAMKSLAKPLLIVPSTTTARIQEMHIMLGQMLCGALEISLGLA
ncbi:MAG: D-sedoheptulose 7-phosphate isomerase [Alphaproteobacteria bacterium]|nr:D-sedoheptulose 7-phosphate isomerase [Alphaproteobacteria bacterium]